MKSYMGSENSSILIGRICQKLDVKNIASSGKKVVNTQVKTWDKVFGKIEYEYHNVVAFGAAAEYMDNYLKDGSPVYIRGKGKTSKWTDDNGGKHEKHQIHIEKIKSLQSGDEEYIPEGRREEVENNRKEFEGEMPF